MVDAYVEFRYDIGNLVWRDCSTKFESWKKVPKVLKKFMLGEFIGMLMKPMRSNRFMWMGFSSRVFDSGSLMCCGRGRIEVEL
ncbi:hypothetical protein D8674_019092 [Pyrus ussuriensis x Pyrus communis]|uniref:Uncharacterized protein n=1 Tax=Pyrus ussuriensis x Pyrus communis TaxID=2448454 RepID=A0A5N5GC10_9ROSA|nr:hypothetical protein D8674_019092 [Pyrus ussuriensis x Pyrus communis]